MLDDGQQLGRYTIRRLLGKGGWGEVYEAWDPELERAVAIKRVPAELAVDEEVRGRFEREARAVATLDHPNIVTIHSIEEVDGARFITMQLVRGQTLDELIPPGGMPLKELFRIAIPLADAVATAHARGVIHRDLKPANVMVTEDGQVKVLDFGLAKLSPSDDRTLATSTQTADGSLLGTLAYMSPEQLRGEPADHRADIFALGIIIYQAATGRVPFQGKSSLEVAASILRDQPSTIASVKRGGPRHLDRIVRSCLQENREQRLQSALDLRNQLEQLRSEVETGGHAPAHQPLPEAGRRRPRWLVPTLALVALAAVAVVALLDRGGPEPPADTAVAAATDPKRIVVLPFSDLGPPEIDYFASGLTEEISSRLAAVDGLGVISRISADQYAGSDKSARQIGEELDVGYILQGTVQWSSNGASAGRVRIAPKLIRVTDDTEIWGQPFQRAVADLFTVQSEIAAEVAGQLGQRLGTTAAGEPAADRPTASLEAYQAYLRGLHYTRRPVYTLENWEQAVAGFRAAVELDPEYTAAWGWLARSHSFIYHLRLDRSAERRRLAREAVERAQALAPDAAETRLATSYYHYQVEQDYERALAELAALERLRPNDYEVPEGRGYVLRRLGRWNEAQISLEKAFELNPRDAAMVAEIGESYAVNREYAAALRWFDQSIALDPDQVYAYASKAWVLLLRDGDLEGARATLAQIRSTDDSMAPWAWFWLEVLDGRPRAALEQLRGQDEWIQSRDLPQVTLLLEAQALELAGDAAGARRAYQEAVELLLGALEREPDEAHHHSALGLAYAGLGRGAEAVRHGRRAVELQPVSKDAFSGTWYLQDLALIYARSGRPEEAIDLLERLVSQPAVLSVPWLRIDPRWRPLREEERFRRLLGADGSV